MSATLAVPECRVPFAPGASEPFAAPPPVVCSWCGGEAVEPYEEVGAIPCLACDGSGVEPADFDLPRTRTHELRRVRYEPTCGMGPTGVLSVTTARKPTHRPTREKYQVVEFDHDWQGRAFHVLKLSDPRRKHQVYAGPDGVRCSCEGETYQSSAKANQRAHEEGEETYPTYGCRHADAVVALLNGGWFDLT